MQQGEKGVSRHRGIDFYNEIICFSSLTGATHNMIREPPEPPELAL